MEVISNGTRIIYDDVGRGEPVLLLMSGWCAPRTYYKDLIALCSSNRRCLVVDWPGHGDSQLPAKDFGEEELVEAARAVLAKSKVRRVVPVAAAHSGWIAIELRRQLGEMVPELVLLDWLVLKPPQEFMGALKGLQTREHWQEVRDALFKGWLSENPNAKIAEYVQKEMRTFGYEMWSRAGREIEKSYDRYQSPLKALEELERPPRVHHIFSIPKDEAFLRDQEKFAEEHSWFRVQRLDGHSHFPALEDPQTVADIIERSLKAP